MNLAQWAKQQGIARATAYRWYKAGKLPVPAKKVGGLILVTEDTPHHDNNNGVTVVYARVSSADQKPDLDRQVARVTQWCTTQGISVDRVVTEVGSAPNGHRRNFKALLEDPTVARIVAEHRDRFSRFGVEYIEAALTAQGRELVVVDPTEDDDDLIQDITGT